MPAARLTSKYLLALDAHTGCAVAVFDAQGQLRGFGRVDAFCQAQNLQAARRHLVGATAPKWLVSAGQLDQQAVWERAALRQGVRVQRLAASDWQAALLGPRAPSAADARRRTVALAKQIIAHAALKAPQRLTLDVAQAICLGLYSARQLGLARAQLHAVGTVAAQVPKANMVSGSRVTGALRRVA